MPKQQVSNVTLIAAVGKTVTAQNCPKSVVCVVGASKQRSCNQWVNCLFAGYYAIYSQALVQRYTKKRPFGVSCPLEVGLCYLP